MAAIPIQELLEESKCYACFAPGDIPTMSALALLSRIAAGGGGGGCVPLAAPVATDGTLITNFGFTANWLAVTGAVAYYLDASTDPLFGSFLIGYNGLAVAAPSVSSAVIQIGLANYYYRVRASALAAGDLSCPSANSNVVVIARIVEDTMQSYTAGNDLSGLNGGTLWSAAYVVRTNFMFVEDTMQSYAAAAALSGLNGGTNWNAAYVSRP